MNFNWDRWKNNMFYVETNNKVEAKNFLIKMWEHFNVDKKFIKFDNLKYNELNNTTYIGYRAITNDLWDYRKYGYDLDYPFNKITSVKWSNYINNN